MEAEMSLQYYRIKNCHALPCLFLNRNGETVIFKKAPDDSKYKIFKMYREFKPDKQFQGIPPAEPALLYNWITLMFDNGLNITGSNTDNELICHGTILPIDRERAEILLAVRETFHNTGVGIQLTRILKKLCEDLGFSKIWLSVESHNVRARSIYAKLGFDLLSRDSCDETWESILTPQGRPGNESIHIDLDEDFFFCSGTFEGILTALTI